MSLRGRGLPDPFLWVLVVVEEGEGVGVERGVESSSAVDRLSRGTLHTVSLPHSTGSQHSHRYY